MAGSTKKEKKEKKEKKQKNEKKKLKLKHPVRFIVIIYLFVLAVLIGIVYFFPWVQNQMADVMTVEYGDLNSSQNQTFYFIKYETVYLADKSGYAGYSYREGSMIRTGVEAVNLQKAKIADTVDYSLFNERVSSFIAGDSPLRAIDIERRQPLIKKLEKKKENTESSAEKLQLDLAILSLENAGSNGSEEAQDVLENVSRSGISGQYQSESSGVISYKVDGYEASLSPYTMKYLDKDEIARIDEGMTDLFDGTVKKGEPIYKVVSNREWFAITWIDRADVDFYKEGSSVVLKLDDGDMPGKIRNVIRRKGDNLVIVRFDSYYKNIATLRKARCKVVTSNEKGLLVKKSFITKKDGKKGVYLVDVTGEAKFTPIKIIAQDGDFALVQAGSFTENGETYSTINVYDEIKKIK